MHRLLVRGCYRYRYEAGSRVPTAHVAANALIEEYRTKVGSACRTDITDTEIVERVVYSLINEGFKVMVDAPCFALHGGLSPMCLSVADFGGGHCVEAIGH